jgi:hypothetical protein
MHLRVGGARRTSINGDRSFEGSAANVGSLGHRATQEQRSFARGEECMRGNEEQSRVMRCGDGADAESSYVMSHPNPPANDIRLICTTVRRPRMRCTD